MNDIKQLVMRIAGVCAILAPLLMLASDLLRIAGFNFEFTIVAWLCFVLFVPAIFGLTYLIAGYGSRLVLIGGASAFVGAVAGASMQVFFRVWAVLTELGSPQTVELLRQSKKLVISTQAIGILFPVGLLIIAACLYWNRVVSPLIVAVLVVGAILFPIGRIGGFEVAIFGSDLLLSVAFVLFGKGLFAAKFPALKN